MIPSALNPLAASAAGCLGRPDEISPAEATLATVISPPGAVTVLPPTVMSPPISESPCLGAVVNIVVFGCTVIAPGLIQEIQMPPSAHWRWQRLAVRELR